MEKSSPQISVSTVDVLVVRGIPRQQPATPALVREGRRGWHPSGTTTSKAPLTPTPDPCHLSLTLGGPSGSIAGALQDLVPLALGGVVGWQPGSGKVGGSPVESQVTAGPGSGDPRYGVGGRQCGPGSRHDTTSTSTSFLTIITPLS